MVCSDSHFGQRGVARLKSPRPALASRHAPQRRARRGFSGQSLTSLEYCYHPLSRVITVRSVGKATCHSSKSEGGRVPTIQDDHAQHVAAFVAEVFGREKPYTAMGGSHAGMIGGHLGRHLTDVQRKRWISMMLDMADELGCLMIPNFAQPSSATWNGERAWRFSIRRMAYHRLQRDCRCPCGDGVLPAVPTHLSDAWQSAMRQSRFSLVVWNNCGSPRLPAIGSCSGAEICKET